MSGQRPCSLPRVSQTRSDPKPTFSYSCVCECPCLSLLMRRFKALLTRRREAPHDGPPLRWSKYRKYLICFAVNVMVLIVGLATVSVIATRQHEDVRSEAVQVASGVSNTIRSQLNNGMSSSFALASMVQQSGDIRNWNRVAEGMFNIYPGITALDLAPNGVIKRIYPENIRAINFSLAADPIRSPYVQRAINTRQLVIQGPVYPLYRNETTLVGRYPVFIKSEDNVANDNNTNNNYNTDGNGDEDDVGEYWGVTGCFMSVALLLNSSNVDDLTNRGYDYWLLAPDPRINDTENNMAIFAANNEQREDIGDAMYVPILVFDQTWWMLLRPHRGWGDASQLWWELVIVLFTASILTFLLFLVLRQPEVLRDMVNSRTGELEVARSNLEASNKALEQLDKMKDRMLANTSHELRTPLMGIIGMADSIITSNLSPEEQHENLVLIWKSGRRLANLVNDILDFETLKNRRNIALHFAPVDLLDVICSVVKLSVIPASKPDLNLRLQVAEADCATTGADDIPVLPRVMADESRLEQILHNLIGNAIKYSEKGNIVVSVERRDDMMQVSVADQGMGVAQEDLPRIFVEFERIDDMYASGSGLGLAITKMLIELHQGQIWVTSEIGRGSCFSFALPIYGTTDITSPSRTRSSLFSSPGTRNETSPPLQRPAPTPGKVTPVRHQSLMRRRLAWLKGRRTTTPPIPASPHLDATPAHHTPTLRTSLDKGSLTKNRRSSTTPSSSSRPGSLEMEPMGPPKRYTPLPIETPHSLTPVSLAPHFSTRLSLSTPLSAPLNLTTPHTPIPLASADPSSLPRPHSPAPPLDLASTTTTATTDSESPPRERRHVLIVDDEDVNRKVFSRYLKDGFEISQAADGMKALALLEGGLRPDIILLDVNMPKMNGYEVCKRIRAVFPEWRLPVLLITAQNQAADIDEGYAARANDYVIKPIQKGPLLRRIWLHLGLASLATTAMSLLPHELVSLASNGHHPRHSTQLSLSDPEAVAHWFRIPGHAVMSGAFVVAFTTNEASPTEPSSSSTSSSSLMSRSLSNMWSSVVPRARSKGGIVYRFAGTKLLVFFTSIEVCLDTVSEVCSANPAVCACLARGDLFIHTIGCTLTDDTTTYEGTLGADILVLSEAIDRACHLHDAHHPSPASLVLTEECTAALKDTHKYSQAQHTDLGDHVHQIQL
eukprot:TRINITY_DN5372_c0_g1_i2.p1 TRINITY_DN5372_c0_g1~~TRINITY_DN5372_c0_g1_i2.p1  ORF type:complete len:1179 (+),score=253.77 TRINITY_DN5372_c0_g1_i2:1-3537(+)